MIYDDLASFISKRIENYEMRAQAALDIIGIDRCPLYHADSLLYSQMADAVQEYIADNELDINPDDIDIETILFTI